MINLLIIPFEQKLMLGFYEHVKLGCSFIFRQWKKKAECEKHHKTLYVHHKSSENKFFNLFSICAFRDMSAGEWGT